MNQMTPSRNSYLAHYGVKGMKWGVRKGPPYPLGSGGKANPFAAKLSDISKTSIDWGKTAVGSALNGDPMDYAVKNPNAYAVVQEWAASSEQSDADPKSYDLGQQIADDFMGGVYEENAPKLDHEESLDERIEAINPNYGQTGYMDNCTGCSMAFWARDHGYDVTAGSFSETATDADVCEYFKDAPGFTQTKPERPVNNSFSKLSDDERERLIEEAVAKETAARAADPDYDVKKKAATVDEAILSNNPDGSYGMFHGTYSGTLSGHSLVYSVDDDSVKYYDCQNNTKYDSTTDMLKEYPFWDESCRYMRTDNLEPNWNNLGKDHRLERRD